MPLDAEGVRQRQRDGRAIAMRDVDRLAREGRALGDIPHVAFEQYRFRSAYRFFRDIREAELGAGAEVGLHRALAVRRDQHVAARGRRAVIEDAAELVVAYLADIGAGAAQVGKAGDRIGDGAARHLGRRTHHVVDLFRAVLVDQRH